jgi:hypothetical protein
VYQQHDEGLEAMRIVVGITDGVMPEVREGLSEDRTIVADSARQAAGGSGGGQRPAEMPGMGGGGIRRGGM